MPETPVKMIFFIYEYEGTPRFKSIIRIPRRERSYRFFVSRNKICQSDKKLVKKLKF